MVKHVRSLRLSSQGSPTASMTNLPLPLISYDTTSTLAMKALFFRLHTGLQLLKITRLTASLAKGCYKVSSSLAIFLDRFQLSRLQNLMAPSASALIIVASMLSPPKTFILWLGLTMPSTLSVLPNTFQRWTWLRHTGKLNSMMKASLGLRLFAVEVSSNSFACPLG